MLDLPPVTLVPADVPDEERWELTATGAAHLAATRAEPAGEDIAQTMSLHHEIGLLRELLHGAIARARETPPKDPILAVTRLTAAVARTVQLQRLLDEGKLSEWDALEKLVLDELDAHDLELRQSADDGPAW